MPRGIAKTAKKGILLYCPGRSEKETSVSTIRNVLVVLSDLKLVEAKVRGLYEITPLGERLLKDILGAK